MSGQQFLTIAGRWKQHVAVSGIDKSLPARELGIAMLMFYAGFSASLDAGLEVAAFADDEAMQLLRALHTEVQQLEAIASRVLNGTVVS